MGDVFYAIRLLRRSPLFTMSVVLITAIGIAGATAIFSIVNAVLIRPLPFDQPDGLMQVAEKNDALHLPAFGASALRRTTHPYDTGRSLSRSPSSETSPTRARAVA